MCLLLVGALADNSSDPVVAEQIIWALARLCRREKDRYFTCSAANIVRLGDAGACEQTVLALRRHYKHAGICLASFKAISNMAVVAQANKTKLRRSGVCEAVVNALIEHLDDENVTDQGCWVITYLGCDHPENKTRLGRSKACEAVVSALCNYPESDVICARACGAIAFLAKDHPENRDRFIRLGAFEQVVKALHKHKDNKGVVQVSCHALLHLYYVMQPERLRELRSEGALDDRGWVADKPYDAVIRVWQPDKVLREVKWKLGGGGLCGLFYCF